jgi:hypothetical protein
MSSQAKDIEVIRKDLHDLDIKVDDIDKDVVELKTNERNNYKSLQRIETKQDKHILMIMSALISLVIGLVLIAVKLSS